MLDYISLFLSVFSILILVFVWITCNTKGIWKNLERKTDSIKKLEGHVDRFNFLFQEPEYLYVKLREKMYAVDFNQAIEIVHMPSWVHLYPISPKKGWHYLCPANKVGVDDIWLNDLEFDFLRDKARTYLEEYKKFTPNKN